MRPFFTDTGGFNIYDVSQWQFLRQVEQVVPDGRGGMITAQVFEVVSLKQEQWYHSTHVECSRIQVMMKGGQIVYLSDPGHMRAFIDNLLVLGES